LNTTSNDNWKKYIWLWIPHTALIVYAKIIIFYVIILLFKNVERSLEQLSWFGLMTVLPSMFYLPFFMRIVDGLPVKKVFQGILLLQFPIFTYLCYTLNQDDPSLIIIFILIALDIALINAESVIFDKSITLLLPKLDYPKAIVISRLANNISFFFSPLLATFFFQNFGLLSLWIIGLLIVLAYFYQLKILSSKNKVEFEKKQKETNISFFKKNKPRQNLLLIELLFFYAISFLWTNAATLIAFPFFIHSESVKTSGLLITISGLGVVINNIYVYFKNKKTDLLFWGRLSGFISGFMFLFLGLINPNFLFYFIIMFLGGFFCSWCYNLAQITTQRLISFNAQGAFFTLRATLNVIITTIFYLLTGYFIKLIFLPFLNQILSLFSISNLPINNFVAIATIFVICGVLIILGLLVLILINFRKYNKHQ